MSGDNRGVTGFPSGYHVHGSFQKLILTCSAKACNRATLTLLVRAIRRISQHWHLYRPDRNAEPKRRFGIELSASARHPCPYFGLHCPNRSFIRRRVRVKGGLSIGRPLICGMTVWTACDRTRLWTHSASKPASTTRVLTQAPRTANRNAAPD